MKVEYMMVYDYIQNLSNKLVLETIKLSINIPISVDFNVPQAINLKFHIQLQNTMMHEFVMLTLLSVKTIIADINSKCCDIRRVTNT